MNKTVLLFIFFLLIISPSFFSQNLKGKLYFYTIDTIVNKKYKNQINLIKATRFYVNKNYDSALIYSQKQLITNSKVKELNDFCHFFRGESFQNKKMFNEALNEVSLISKNFIFYHRTQFITGQLYIELFQLNRALICFFNVENNLSKSFVDSADLYENIGICYLHLKKYNESENYLLKASTLYEKDTNYYKLLVSNQNIANLYYEQYKDKQAILYFEKAYKLSKKINNYSCKKQCAKNMAVVEENRKNYAKALIYSKEAQIWNDSLNDQNKIWAVAEAEKKFAIQQKQKEIHILEVENEIKMTQRNGLFIVAVFLFCMFGIVFYFYRQKINANKIILAQKENLDELNATKDKLFTIVSHDLRSSVNALKTSNTKLLNHLETKNYEQLDVLLHKNIAIANSSYNLLDNMLNWAQQQTNQLFFQIESLHLFSIVQQIEYNYNSLFFDKNITLKTTIDKTIFVNMDLDSLKIILRNMLDNALKFSKINGTISIYTQNNDANFIQLVIEDTGIGMSKQVVNELLQETMLLSKKNNKEVIGSGLGMQLCKSMLTKNGGKLDIQSKENLGTKIILFLPKDDSNG